MQSIRTQGDSADGYVAKTAEFGLGRQRNARSKQQPNMAQGDLDRGQ